MLRRLFRLTSPGVFVTVVLHGTASQRVTVLLGVVLFAVALGVLGSMLLGHVKWLVVLVLGWIVCEVGARDFLRSRRKRS